jgi:hypothetical protein
VSNRIIKESVCTSRSMAMLSAEAERLLYRLWTTCDNHGRFESDPQIVRAKCFPRMLDKVTEDEVARWLDEIQKVETIVFYEAGEQLYGYHPKWKDHNSLRTEKSRYPNPPERVSYVSMRSVMRERREAQEAVAKIDSIEDEVAEPTIRRKRA